MLAMTFELLSTTVQAPEQDFENVNFLRKFTFSKNMSQFCAVRVYFDQLVLPSTEKTRAMSGYVI